MLTDDQILVRRVLAGDAGAFEAFFDAYFQRLFRFAVRRLGDADAAEDAVQQTLALALRKLDTWRGEAALFTWLCTICRREIGRLVEQGQRRPLAIAPDDDPMVRAELEALAADVESPQTSLERAEVSQLVQIALDYLPG